MTTAGPLYLFDTGPLLCFAAVPRGPTLLKQRYAGRAGCLVDIDADLTGLTRNTNAKVAKAASTALQAFTWMARYEITDEALLVRIDTIRDLIDTFKRRPRVGQRRPREDWGEAATLTLAETLDERVVVINEDAARGAADALRVPNICTVDILRAMVRDSTLSAAEAYRLYRAMVPELDAGDVIRSAADLR